MSYFAKLENWKECGFKKVVTIKYMREHEHWHLSWTCGHHHYKDNFTSLEAAKNYIRNQGSVISTPRFQWKIW